MNNQDYIYKNILNIKYLWVGLFYPSTFYFEFKNTIKTQTIYFNTPEEARNFYKLVNDLTGKGNG